MSYNKERTMELLRQDIRDTNELIKLNEGLVGMQLKRFGLLKEPDAISLAYEGLLDAINTFDVTKNIAFSTYASVCIYNTLGCYIRRLKRQGVTIVSYNALLDSSTNKTFEEVLCTSDTTESEVLNKLTLQVLQQRINEYVDDGKDNVGKDILKSWIQSDFTKTQQQLCAEHNCSQSYVNKVLKSFKNDLRGFLTCYQK